MPKFRITSPDGRTFDVDAPEGASAQDAMAYVQRMHEPTSHAGSGFTDNREGKWGPVINAGHGVLQGLGDEASAAIAATKEAIRPDGLPWGNAYDQALSVYRGARDQYRDQHPVEAVATEGGGALASAIVAAPYAAAAGARVAGAAPQFVQRLAAPVSEFAQNVGARVAQAAPRTAQFAQNVGVGAGMGGAYGFNEGEGGFIDRMGEAGKGAAIGGALGGTIPAVVGAVGAGARKAAQPILDRMGPQSAAGRDIIKALADNGMTVDDAATELSRLGPNATLADIIPNYAELVANTPGKGAEAAKILQQRMEGQGARLSDSVNANLSGRDMVGTADDLIAQRSADARPLYEEAFQGGSTAPLKVQLENAFASASNAEGDAARAVQQAQQAMTIARAQVSRAGNDVYAANGALAAERQAAAQLKAAERALQEAQGAKNSVLERLRVSQSDEASNAPGAVWSPRIQQFLDDPISKSGLARGLEVQRLEALAQGRRFDPAELAITGMNDAGEPVVSKVPNLRTLDAVKRGLDEIINGYRDPVTGKVNLDQRGRAVEQVRSALVKQLDELTGGEGGAYSQARAAWAGPSQGLDAMARGRSFNNVDPRILQKTVSGMSDGERELFRAGVADKVKEIISRTQDGADATRRMFGNERIRDQLRAVFPDEASFNGFVQDVEREALFARNRNQIVGNSRTAYRQAGQEDMGFDPSGAVGNALMGNFGSAVTDGARSLARMLKRPPRSVGDQAAPLLFQQGDNAATITALTQRAEAMKLTDQQRRSLARMLAQGGGAAAGVGVAR